MDIQITNIDRIGNNDLTIDFTMRWRLLSDPDVDASYTTVTTTKTIGMVVFPFFDISSMPDGVYVVHTYYNSSGPTTGTKLTVEKTGFDPV